MSKRVDLRRNVSATIVIQHKQGPIPLPKFGRVDEWVSVNGLIITVLQDDRFPDAKYATAKLCLPPEISVFDHNGNLTEGSIQVTISGDKVISLPLPPPPPEIQAGVSCPCGAKGEMFTREALEQWEEFHADCGGNE